MTNEKKFRFAPLSGKKIELKGGTGGLIGRTTDHVHADFYLQARSGGDF